MIKVIKQITFKFFKCVCLSTMINIKLFSLDNLNATFDSFQMFKRLYIKRPIRNNCILSFNINAVDPQKKNDRSYWEDAIDLFNLFFIRQ